MPAIPEKVTKKSGRKLVAIPDSADFRDLMYLPTLVEVPRSMPLEEHLKREVPLLDQGQEGTCTGFALATVVNTLAILRRDPFDGSASPHMLYEMAKRYDEWPGEKYEGSSARGAVKGWHKHGVCTKKLWDDKRALSREISDDALGRPLGAYYRVNHKDLVALHAALAEVGILYATTQVHEGWDELGRDGAIPFKERFLGAHAIAIVGYDPEGFWFQNSWGADWGRDGFGRISYDDWLTNATDVWVCRLGAPVETHRKRSIATLHSAAVPRSSALSLAELRRHIVSIGNDGHLYPSGDYGTSEAEVDEVVAQCQAALEAWRAEEPQRPRRVLLYAHGGLVDQASAVQVLADLLPPFMAARVYPISFIWRSDFWTTLKNILDDAGRRRRPEGVLDRAKDFMLDRLDDALEPLARLLGGKAQWDEMKENALKATIDAGGGARYLADRLVQVLGKEVEIHLIGHSAGSIFHAPLVQYLATTGRIESGPMGGSTGLGATVQSCTLWAPAVSVELFKESYLPLIGTGIRQFHSFVLTKQAEEDDNCSRIYNKSLLYLVSHAFEATPRIPLFREGSPIFGMKKFIEADKELTALFRTEAAKLVLSPNDSPTPANAATARHHGDFDNDKATIIATLQRITGEKSAAGRYRCHRSLAKLREQRRNLER